MINSKQERVFQLVSHLVMIFIGLTVIIPFLIMLSSSFSSETSILAEGYSLFPRDFSTDAYQYILGDSTMVLRAYGVTIFVTVVGTVVSLLITNMYGDCDYAVQRRFSSYLLYLHSSFSDQGYNLCVDSPKFTYERL